MVKTVRSGIPFGELARSLTEYARKLPDYERVRSKTLEISFGDGGISLSLTPDSDSDDDGYSAYAHIAPKDYSDGNCLKVECASEESVGKIMRFLEEVCGQKQERITKALGYEPKPAEEVERRQKRMEREDRERKRQRIIGGGQKTWAVKSVRRKKGKKGKTDRLVLAKPSTSDFSEDDDDDDNEY